MTSSRTKRTHVRLLGRQLAVLVLVAAFAGCASSERVCSRGEVPVLLLAEDGQLTGGACVREGAEPPPGFVRYPPDLEPTLVKDQDAATRRFQERLD